MPLVVIRSETYEDVLSEHLWERTQADLATLSTEGMVVEALDSGHFVIDENPDVVVRAVTVVVDVVRAGSELPQCEEAFLGVHARCHPA